MVLWGFEYRGIEILPACLRVSGFIYGVHLGYRVPDSQNVGFRVSGFGFRDPDGIFNIGGQGGGGEPYVPKP